MGQGSPHNLQEVECLSILVAYVNSSINGIHGAFYLFVCSSMIQIIGKFENMLKILFGV